LNRISNLFLCLVLTLSTAAFAQDAANKSVSGRVISSSAFELVLQTDAGTRLNLVVDSATSKPAILSEGDQVTVVYRPLDAGGFQAVQVLEGTEKTAPAEAGTPNRTLTNTATPGTMGQTGTSRTTVVGTTGNYNSPASPPQPSKPMESTPDTSTTPETTTATTATTPMNDTDTMDHSMANDETASTTATDKTATNDNTSYGDSLPQTASPEPEILVLGLVALGAAALLLRRRSTVR
jgi:LPXTG-motif cell wall-anchored protein